VDRLPPNPASLGSPVGAPLMNFQIRRSTPLFGPSAPRPFPLRGRPAQTLYFVKSKGSKHSFVHLSSFIGFPPGGQFGPARPDAFGGPIPGSGHCRNSQNATAGIFDTDSKPIACSCNFQRKQETQARAEAQSSQRKTIHIY